MAQRKFGTRRRAMLSFERQPFPAPCHVDQDVAHSGLVRARTSDDIRSRALCTLPPKSFARSPEPLELANAATTTQCGQRRFPSGVHFGANCDLCAQHNLRALRVRTLWRPRQSSPFWLLSSCASSFTARVAWRCLVEGLQNLHQHLRRGDRAAIRKMPRRWRQLLQSPS